MKPYIELRLCVGDIFALLCVLMVAIMLIIGGTALGMNHYVEHSIEDAKEASNN